MLFCTLIAGALTLQAEDAPPTYLPLVSYQPTPTTIYGAVTQDGQPAAGIEVRLLYAGLPRMPSATTDARGYYHFMNVPPPPAGGSYYVYAMGTQAFCFSPLIGALAEGEVLRMQAIDITALVTLEPADGATVRLPATFRWQRRPHTPTDTYDLRLHESEDPFLIIGNLGYVDSATVTEQDLAGHLDYDRTYSWSVVSQSPAGQCGFSGYHPFTLSE